MFAGLEVIPTLGNNSFCLGGGGKGGSRNQPTYPSVWPPSPTMIQGEHMTHVSSLALELCAFAGWSEKKRLSLPAAECQSGPAWSHRVTEP